jgi:hypothetical protein
MPSRRRWTRLSRLPHRPPPRPRSPETRSSRRWAIRPRRPKPESRWPRQASKPVGWPARRGVTTIIEKIDPGLLADVVIKATALQEKANTALRAKKSPYRISEVVISAAIPPQVSFAIARKDDYDEQIVDARESTELVDVATGEEGAVLALDGSGPPVDEIDGDEATDVEVRDVDPRG